MQASRKIKLTYPSVDSFCKEYKKNIRFGGVYIPTRKPAQFNDIIQITLTIPEIDDPLVINARVVQVNTEADAGETSQKPGMALHAVESDLPLLDGLKQKLQQLEIYREKLDLAPPEEKAEDEPEPSASEEAEPWADLKITPPAEEKPEEESLDPEPEAKPAGEIREKESPAPEEPAPSPELKSTPSASKEPEEKAREPGPEEGPEVDQPARAPKVKIEWDTEEKTEKEAVEPLPAKEEPLAKPEDAAREAEPVSEPKVKVAKKPGGRLTDQAIEDLRKMVGNEDTMARPSRKEIAVARPAPEPARKTLTEPERRRLMPVAKLAMSLVKAMLRTGYYSPDHPGSQDAKQGLYKEFNDAILDETEISFISRITQEATDILVGGVLDEPVSLRTVIPGTQAEMFFPKYKDYFERKRLVSFTIKRDIDELQFNDFIDIMSDPEVDKGEGKGAGKTLTNALAEKGIINISAVFEDDLIRLEIKLPWRVEMAINRLAKDLKMLPMYQDVNREDIQRLKIQIIQDIIRPLRQPHLLKDILVNAHVIARKVEEIEPEELEKTIISCFPMEIMVSTSEFIFTEMTELKEEVEKNPDIEVLKNRLEGVKRVLKWISLRVVEENIEDALDFLEQLYFHEILTFEELPQAVQDRINTLRLAKEFQRNSQFYLGRFKEVRVQEDHIFFLRFFSRILPELLDDNDYQNIYLLTQGIYEAGERDPELLREIRGDIEDEIPYVWASCLPLLKDRFMGAKKETRTGLDEILVLLGKHGIEILIQVLEESQDRWVRKSSIDLLIKHGDLAREHVRALLDDPTHPWALHRNSLFIIGNIGDSDDLDRATHFMRHSDARLREESLNTVSRLEGSAAEPKILRALRDNDPRVRRRAAACLGLFQSVSGAALVELAGIVEPPEKHLEDEKERDAEDGVRVQAIRTLGILGNQPLDEENNVEDLLIGLISTGKGWAKKLISRVSKAGEQSEKVQMAAVDTLGKIGTKKSIEALDKLIESKEGAFTSKIKDAVRQIEARGVEQETEKAEAPEAEPVEPEGERTPEPEAEPPEKGAPEQGQPESETKPSAPEPVKEKRPPGSEEDDDLDFSKEIEEEEDIEDLTEEVE